MAVLLTGASAGFGTAISRVLVKAGYTVYGAARRYDKLSVLQQKLGARFCPLEMDVASEKSVNDALATLPEQGAEIDLLINNAGLALGLEGAHEAKLSEWETMIHTNVLGLMRLTHKILPHMVAKKRGYVMNFGSTAGSYPYPGGNVYGASKAFVRQFSLNLRADLAGSGVRVTNIEPGLCGGTEFSHVRFRGDVKRAQAVYESVESLTPDDIAATVLWLYQTPSHMNVNRIEIMPTSQSFGPWSLIRCDNNEAKA